MARRGRPRKADAKRGKGGKIAKPTTKAAREGRVLPTPEMAQRKARAPYDWADPIAQLEHAGTLTPQEAEALSRYRTLVFDCLASVGPSQNITGAIKERIGGGGVDPAGGERDERRARERRRMQAVLVSAGSEADRAVHQIIMEMGCRLYEARFLDSLRIGARALAIEQGLYRRDAA